jgi:hypothetical protein
VKRRPFSTDLECHVSSYLLTEAPLFEAISYTWGNPRAIREISLNGKPFSITQNAYDALYSVSDPFGSKHVWIDSIDINQDNPAENSSQVRLMTDIYSRASSVIVWLGNSEDSWAVNQILNELQVLRQGREEHVTNMPSVGGIRDMPLGRNNPEYWQLFLRLYELAWFQRIWVIQEVARRVYAIWGDSFVSWNALDNAFKDFIEQSANNPKFSTWKSSIPVDFTSITRAASITEAMKTIQHRLRDEDPFPLHSLLAVDARFEGDGSSG